MSQDRPSFISREDTSFSEVIVSDRAPDKIFKMLQLEPHRVQRDEFVVNSGAGLFLRFEEYLKRTRGARIAVIDASLALNSSHYTIYTDTSHSRAAYVRTPTRPPNIEDLVPISSSEFDRFQKNRLEKVQKICMVALACKVPSPAIVNYFSDQVQWFFDCFGPATYLDEPQEFFTYVHQAVGSLKKNEGQATFFPVDEHLPLWQHFIKDRKLRYSQYDAEIAGTTLSGIKIQRT